MILPSQNRQNEMWLFLAILWWMGSLIAWLSAWIIASPASDPNQNFLLTLGGLTCFAVSAALRLPVLTDTHTSTSLENHFVWLISTVANVNWIGYMALVSSSLLGLISPLIVGLMLEAWLWHQAYRSNCIQWNLTWLKNIWGSSDSSEDLTHQVCGNPDLSASDPGQQISEATNSESGRQPLRRVEDYLDANGQRCLAGDISVIWGENELSRYEVVGFVPAFEGSPSVEFDSDSEDAQVSVQHCTPAGMRIHIKRTSTASQPELSISWFARQNLDSTDSPRSAITPP